MMMTTTVSLPTLEPSQDKSSRCLIMQIGLDRSPKKAQLGQLAKRGAGLALTRGDLLAFSFLSFA